MVQNQQTDRIYDIWTIHTKEELKTALSKIKMGHTILFKNLESEFILNGKKVSSRRFSNAIVNEESDIFIMILDGVGITDEFINDILLANPITSNYSTVTSSIDQSRIDNLSLEEKEHSPSISPNLKKIWICRDPAVLDESLEHMKEFNYYHNISGTITLNYKNEQGDIIFSISLKYEGYLELDDKISLIINDERNITPDGVNKNITFEEIIGLLKKHGINYMIYYSLNPLEK